MLKIFVNSKRDLFKEPCEEHRFIGAKKSGEKRRKMKYWKKVTSRFTRRMTGLGISEKQDENKKEPLRALFYFTALILIKRYWRCLIR